MCNVSRGTEKLVPKSGCLFFCLVFNAARVKPSSGAVARCICIRGCVGGTLLNKGFEIALMLCRHYSVQKTAAVLLMSIPI